ncbi:E1-E2 ATPase-domain-containing protein [Lactifluus subvellereus]|nr:E1-E2 ATPase-domain-containing protein [Lactifluus subvellereus]
MDEDLEAENICKLEDCMELFEKTANGETPKPPAAHAHDSEHSLETIAQAHGRCFISLSLLFLPDLPVDWVEGVNVIVSILIVTFVSSLNDWQKERQFKALDKKKEDRLIEVIHDGEERQLDIHQVVVGDVMLLELGEIIPCDGVFLSGHNKISYEERILLRNRRLAEPDLDSAVGEGDSVSSSQGQIHLSRLDLLGHTDCFVVSGSKVLEGVGSYVVISVGTKSFNGHIMMALRRDSENTPLQLKLNDLAEQKLGSIASVFFSPCY